MEVGTIISLKNIKGVVKYVGDFHEGEGTYVGIELEKPKGRNNGTIKGKKYFECPEGHGLFLKIEDITRLCKIVSKPLAVSRSTDKFESLSHGPLLKESRSSSEFEVKTPVHSPSTGNLSIPLNTPQNSSKSPISSSPKLSRGTPSNKVWHPLPKGDQSPKGTRGNPTKNNPNTPPAKQAADASKSKHMVTSASGNLNAKSPKQSNGMKLIKSTKDSEVSKSSNFMSKNSKTHNAENQHVESPLLSTKPSPKPSPATQSSSSSKKLSNNDGKSTTPSPQSNALKNDEGEDVENDNKTVVKSISADEINPHKQSPLVDPQEQLPIAKTSRETSSLSPTTFSSKKLQKNQDTLSSRMLAEIEETVNEAEGEAVNDAYIDKTLISPDLLKKISELKAKLEGYGKQRNLIKKKLLDIAELYKKEKAENHEKIVSMAEETKTKLIQTQVNYEAEMTDLETQILESAERTRRYLEVADEARAQKVMEILTLINEEHARYEEDLELFINAQRINVNTATQSVHILNERLKKVAERRIENDKRIVLKKDTLNDKENELAEKRPRWQEVTELRTTFSELSEKAAHTKRMSLYKEAERDGVKKFYQLFSEVPLLDSLYVTLSMEQKTTNNEILHLCKLSKLVLGGFISNATKSTELFNQLREIDESIDTNENPPSLLGVIGALEAVSSITLENAITSNYLNNYANKISNEEVKAQVLQLAKEITVDVLHPALLDNDQKEEYTELVKSLIDELKRAEIGEEDCDLKEFFGKFEKFSNNAAHKDIVQEFINFHLPPNELEQNKISPEVQKKQQEKKDLLMKSQLMEEEIKKEKLKFESLRNELAEPMKLYTDLAEQLGQLKKELSKYQT
ncbi:hypothetical protein TRFO_23835 [Tritrichomonas foetus]|uniref:CAP-Gly domain-containing protein n=1 Tax=Tritrichomonas foetus TaxID=1144522 RepID=A0A1J4KDL4_9EUKA|nr:hypothetical protein TRFO_23835 [Tritrichomonas foetus]|eukprot:OHT07804.1 hypothetical protein TRFO_23835 [Tritrichomonas foetus]